MRTRNVQSDGGKAKPVVWHIAMLSLAAVVVLAVLLLIVLSVASRRRPALGLIEGRLRPCPASPNCVSSESGDADQRMAPIPFAGSPEDALERLTMVVAGMPRARVVTADGDYMHVEFASSVFRFVDDVEFRIDAGSGVIHFRSASRVGHSDLGANRKRMAAIARAFAAVNDM